MEKYHLELNLSYFYYLWKIFGCLLAFLDKIIIFISKLMRLQDVYVTIFLDRNKSFQLEYGWQG